MAETRRSAGETVRVMTQPADRLKVWHLLDFADAVRAAGIPDTADVTAHKAHTTGHTTGLSTSHHWATEPLGYEPAPTDPAGAATEETLLGEGSGSDLAAPAGTTTPEVDQ